MPLSEHPVVINSLIGGLAVFIAQGEREQSLVLWNPLETAEAASGQKMKISLAPADLEASAQGLDAEAYDDKANEIQA